MIPAHVQAAAWDVIGPGVDHPAAAASTQILAAAVAEVASAT